MSCIEATIYYCFNDLLHTENMIVLLNERRQSAIAQIWKKRQIICAGFVLLNSISILLLLWRQLPAPFWLEMEAKIVFFPCLALMVIESLILWRVKDTGSPYSDGYILVILLGAIALILEVRYAFLSPSWSQLLLLGGYSTLFLVSYLSSAVRGRPSNQQYGVGPVTKAYAPPRQVRQEYRSSGRRRMVEQIVLHYYDNRDMKFVEGAKKHFWQLKRERMIQVRDINATPLGSQWQEERRQFIESADIIVLWLSANFFDDETNAHHEHSIIVQRARRNEVGVLCIYVGPYDCQGTEFEQFYALNSPEKPLSRMPGWQREKVFIDLARMIRRRCFS